MHLRTRSAAQPLTRLNRFSFPARGHPIRWCFDLREVFTEEFSQLTFREENSPYHRGETSIRPGPISDGAHDDGESEVDSDEGHDVAMTSDASADEDEDDTDTSDTSSARSEPKKISEVAEEESSEEDDSMSEEEPSPYTFSSSQGTTEVIVRRGQAARAGAWAIRSIRPFSPFDLQPRHLTMGKTPLDDIKPPRFSLSRIQVLNAGLKPFDCRAIPTPIMDNKGRIVAVIVPAPTDAIGWRTGVIEASGVFDRAAGYADYSRLQDPILTVGVEYGGRRGPKPQNFELDLANLVEVNLLMRSEAIQDIAAFQNTIYESFAPELYGHSKLVLDALFELDPELRRAFPGAFSASQFDLGDMGSAPRLEDRDLLYGWRAITALGSYDARYGGDIVLWDDGFVIRFPPGATILLPAAIMRFSFVDVRPGEAQYTFSQYASAGLFRYAENGYLSDSTFERRASTKERAARGRRMEAALGMYSNIEDFVNDV